MAAFVIKESRLVRMEKKGIGFVFVMKKWLLSFFSLCWFLFAGYAQAETMADSIQWKDYDSLWNVMEEQFQIGSYEEASETLDWLEKIAFSDSSQIERHGLVLFYRTMICSQQNDLEQAEIVLRQFADLVLAYPQFKENGYYAACVYMIARLKIAQGQYMDALSFLETVVMLSMQNPNDYIYGLMAQIDRGTVYTQLQQYEKSLNILIEIEPYAKAAWGKFSSQYATLLNNLLVCYLGIGDITRASYWGRDLLDLYKEIYQGDHPDIARTYGNIGYLYYRAGDTEQALQYMLESMEMYSRLYPDYLTNDYLMVIQNAALVFAEEGQWQEAVYLYEYCMEAYEKNPDRYSRYNIALIAYNMGSYEMLLERYQESREHLSLALELWKGVYGENIGYYYRETIGFFSLLEFMQGNIEKSMLLYREYFDLVKQDVMANFAFMTQEEREAYWEKLQGVFLCAVDYAPEFLALDSSFSEDIYDGALFSKGLSLSVSLDRNRMIESIGDSALVQIKDELLYYRHLLDKTAEKDMQDSLIRRISVLERQMAEKNRFYADFQNNAVVAYKDVAEHLSPGEVSVEFLHSVPCDRYPIFYMAVLMRSDWERPKVVSLFNTSQIEDYLKLSPSKLYQSYVSKKLYKLIWKPLETYVRPGDKVYFSPAGLLHTVNMEALQDEAGLCAYQKFSLERLGSTKQLCQGIKRSGKLTKKLLHGAEVVLYGGLNYEVDTLQMSDTCISANSPDLLVWNSRGQLPEIDSVLRIGWEYLPETKTEVEQIRQMLEKKGVQVQEFAAQAGTEESFKNLSGKDIRILHLATHGFFLPLSEAEEEVYYRNLPGMGFVTIEPMKRSGLILSGGQPAWLGEGTSSDREDGVLLSQEIANMDFTQTDLVVLSACETALGDVSPEGVWGLQRAFKQAGVQTLVMSLWQVNDYATSLMMRSFYGNLLKGKDKRAAFDEARERVREWNDDPYYWASFIMLD